MSIALSLAQAHSQVREFERALAQYERALAHAEALDDRYTALQVRWSIGYVAISQGDLRRAREIGERVLAEERTAGEPMTIVASLELLVWVALAGGDLDAAAEKLAEAWRIVGAIPPWAEAVRTNLLIDEAVLAYRREDFARSAAKVGEWLPDARARHSRQDLLLALLLFASIASRHDRSTEAARWFGALYAGLAESEHGMHLEPAIRPWHEADMARAREALGDEAFDRAKAAGSRLPLEEALAEAEWLIRSQFDAPEAVEPSTA
jgi:non-specific serine/threonine protein kinase